MSAPTFRFALQYENPIAVARFDNPSDAEFGILQMSRTQDYAYIWMQPYPGETAPDDTEISYVVAESGVQDIGGLKVEAGQLRTEVLEDPGEGQPAEWESVLFAGGWTRAPWLQAGLQSSECGNVHGPLLGPVVTGGFELTIAGPGYPRFCTFRTAEDQDGSGSRTASGRMSFKVGWIALEEGTGVTENGYRLFIEEGTVDVFSEGPGRRPTASFEATNAFPEVGEAIRFVDSSGNSPDRWQWTFGDGSTSTNQSPWHVFSEPGSYLVELTVSSDYGSDTAEELIQVGSDVLFADSLESGSLGAWSTSQD